MFAKTDYGWSDSVQIVFISTAELFIRRDVMVVRYGLLAF